MPELAGMYTVGTLCSLLLSGLFIYLWSRYQRRAEALLLNENLKKQNLFWSEKRDRLVDFDETAAQEDFRSSRRSLLATSLGLSFLSWVGFFFLLTLMISYRFLARSRLEKRLLATDLARDPNLVTDQVRITLEELMRDFPQALDGTSAGQARDRHSPAGPDAR